MHVLFYGQTEFFCRDAARGGSPGIDVGNGHRVFVCFEEKPVGGCDAERFGLVFFAERQVEIMAQQAFRHLRFAPEAVYHPSLAGSHGLFECQQLVRCFHQVYDERFFRLFRQQDLLLEGLQLKLHGCGGQMVKARFANGQHLRMSGHSFQLFKLCGERGLPVGSILQVPWMDAHGVPPSRLRGKPCGRAVRYLVAALGGRPVCVYVPAVCHGVGDGWSRGGQGTGS